MIQVAFPNLAHGLSSVAAPRLAECVFCKDASPNLRDIILVDPATAGCGYSGRIVQEEAIEVGVPKIIEGTNASTSIM